MLRKLYAVIGILILGGYAWAGWRGLELPKAEKRILPQSVRSAPGGYRAYRYIGYHGGK
jgi:hypothetical protein